MDTSNGGMNKHNGVFTVPVGQGGIYQVQLESFTVPVGQGGIYQVHLALLYPWARVADLRSTHLDSRHSTTASSYVGYS